VSVSVGLFKGCTIEKQLIDLDTDWVMSGVGRGMRVLDESGNRRKGKGSVGGKCGASHCN